ncbi:MAG: DUF2283 domain-containing protein [Chloroflexi bacterium]|nr:DUF2283 domain-containing protein [Chloroflexota bacterium]
MNIIVSFESRGSLYVQFSDIQVARTVELIKDELLFDLDEYNNVIGIEAFTPGMLTLAFQRIPETYRLPEEARLINFEALDKALIRAGVGA